jgi:alpha-ketoglutarate-dependent taurine dioxygenase
MTETVTSRKISIQRNAAPLGAEIAGVDLAQELDDATFEQVKNAYFRHSVIVFRDQKLTPQQQVSFSRRFSELEIHVLKQYLLPGHPEILVVSNIVESGRLIGLADAGRVAVWHTDMSYLRQPSAGSALYALEIPHDEAGAALGNTLFASTFAAYDALPESMRKRLAGLQATHHMTKGYDSDETTPQTRINYRDDQVTRVPDQAHPIIRTHPVTGRKCIYINKLCVTGIVGMADGESGPLLEELYSHCARPEFIYSHQWRVGDLLMWDNCSAQHLAVQDYALPQRRRMHRTTLKGSVPF